MGGRSTRMLRAVLSLMCVHLCLAMSNGRTCHKSDTVCGDGLCCCRDVSIDRGTTTDDGFTAGNGRPVYNGVTTENYFPIENGMRNEFAVGVGITIDYGTLADCQDRQLRFIPDLPSNTTTVLFNKNRIGNITIATFHNLRKLPLRQLYIKENYIDNISPNAFVGLSNLTVLDMSNNIQTNKTALSLAFKSLETTNNLTLILSEINVAHIPDDFFDGLVHINLRKLVLNNNLLTSFKERTFEKLKSLQVLQLTNNTIGSITGYTLRGFQNLEELFLDDNVFALYPPIFCRENQTDSTYPNLKNLHLGKNLITIIPKDHWYCLSQLRKLSLYGNVIATIRNNVFASLQSLEILNLSDMRGTLNIVEPNALNSTSLLELNLNNNRLNFRAKDTTDKMNIFKACPNLQKLYLSDNSVNHLKKKALIRLLSPLVKLRMLLADHLRLSAIPDGLLQQFPELQKLSLNANYISKWNHSTFENLTQLDTLSLQANNIHSLKTEHFPENLQKSLQTLNLANNPLSCACDNLWFRNWINETLSKGKMIITAWPRSYMCATPPEWKGKQFKYYHPTDAECSAHDPLIVVYVSMGSSLVVFTFISLVVYRQRWYIRYWLYKLKRNHQRHINTETQPLLINEENKERMYDAYVIYNDEDRQFVHEDLRKQVEETYNKRLCIRHRDSPLGVQIDSLVDSIYASRNTIAVISQNFVIDPWCQFQLKVTLDRQVELGRTCLLLVVLENIKMKALNKTWCVILTKTPTAEWCPDKDDIRNAVFQQKLLKALAN